MAAAARATTRKKAKTKAPSKKRSSGGRAQSRKKSDSGNSSGEPERSGTWPMVIGFIVVAIAGLIWFLQGEANDLERERRLRALPGGDAWLTENLNWVGDGGKADDRAVWLGEVVEIIRTDPGGSGGGDRPELIAIRLGDAERISGSSAREPELYVVTRSFSWSFHGLDEPLSGTYWLVATFKNEHGQRLMYKGMPVRGWDPELPKE